jgi:hypothetical protein
VSHDSGNGAKLTELSGIMSHCIYVVGRGVFYPVRVLLNIQYIVKKEGDSFFPEPVFNNNNFIMGCLP